MDERINEPFIRHLLSFLMELERKASAGDAEALTAYNAVKQVFKNREETLLQLVMHQQSRTELIYQAIQQSQLARIKAQFG